MVKKLHLEKNMVVLVKGALVGTIKFIGKITVDSAKEPEVMVGIKLGEGTGDSDGSYKGVRYFDSPKNGAIFIPPTEVQKIIKAEDLLNKIVFLNKKKKNNNAEISRLKDELNLAKNSPAPKLAGGDAQKKDGDSDGEIASFLDSEIKKKWFISLQDLQYRYGDRSANDVANIYNSKKASFQSMEAAAPHARIVYTVSASSRDNMVASGSDDKSIRLWRRIYPGYPASAQTEEMRCITELKLRSCINSLAFHPTQDMLAAALDSGWIELYDLHTGKMMGALEGQSTSEVWTVCFSPDGNNILSGSLDRAIRVWDVRERECKWALRGHDEWVNGISVSSDGTTICSGSGDKTVRIWDTKTMASRAVMRGHDDFVRSVCVTGDNKYVVSASDDCSLRVWDIKTGQCVKPIKAHNKGIYCVSASGTKVVSSSRDFSVKVWDVNGDGKKPLQTFSKHRGDVNSCCFFDDGKWVASCSDDKKVLCFKLNA